MDAEIRELSIEEMAIAVGGGVNKLASSAEELLGLPPPTWTEQLLYQIQDIVNYLLNPND